MIKHEPFSSEGLQEASSFFSLKAIPANWKMDMREILESSSSDEEEGAEARSDDEVEEKTENKEEEVVVSVFGFLFVEMCKLMCSSPK